MAPRTLTYTVAQIAAWVSKAAPDSAPFGLSAQLAWYQHTKSERFRSGYHHKRFGNVKAAVSRNKREGKYIGHANGKAHRAVRLGKWQYNLKFCKYPGWMSIRVHLRY